jgi:transcriptional regulator with XRE-family HTH domain
MKKKNIIGEKIKEARLSENPKATQRDLCARLEFYGVTLSDNSIGKIERGERAVTDIQALAFSKALKVSISWLYDEKKYTF